MDNVRIYNTDWECQQNFDNNNRELDTWMGDNAGLKYQKAAERLWHINTAWKIWAQCSM